MVLWETQQVLAPVPAMAVHIYGELPGKRSSQTPSTISRGAVPQHFFCVSFVGSFARHGGFCAGRAT